MIALILPYTLFDCELSVDTLARAEVPIVVEGVIGVVADSVCLIVVVPVGLF